jgi:hypothetical protein
MNEFSFPFLSIGNGNNFSEYSILNGIIVCAIMCAVYKSTLYVDKLRTILK